MNRSAIIFQLFLKRLSWQYFHVASMLRKWFHDHCYTFFWLSKCCALMFICDHGKCINRNPDLPQVCLDWQIQTRHCCPSENKIAHSTSWSVELNSTVGLLSPSVTSRASGWTCWGTRGRSSVRPSSSEPIWRRGRWRCEICLHCKPVPWISVVFISLCLLCLVSVTLVSVEHIFKPKQRENQLSGATLCILSNLTRQPEGVRKRKMIGTSCLSLETNNRGEMHYGSCSPGQSEVG